MSAKEGGMRRAKTAAAVLLVFVLAGWAKCRQERRFARELMEDRYRAVPVRLDAWQLRHIRAGDRVDVLATFEALMAGGAKRKATATMLQNVKVLGVDRPWKSSEKGTLILKLNPVEAQYAFLGPSQADLGVALRHRGDGEIYPMEMSTFMKLLR